MTCTNDPNVLPSQDWMHNLWGLMESDVKSTSKTEGTTPSSVVTALI